MYLPWAQTLSVPDSHRPLRGASWQVTVPGLCPWPMMLPVIY